MDARAPLPFIEETVPYPLLCCVTILPHHVHIWVGLFWGSRLGSICTFFLFLLNHYGFEMHYDTCLIKAPYLVLLQ